MIRALWTWPSGPKQLLYLTSFPDINTVFALTGQSQYSRAPRDSQQTWSDNEQSPGAVAACCTTLKNIDKHLFRNILGTIVLLTLFFAERRRKKSLKSYCRKIDPTIIKRQLQAREQCWKHLSSRNCNIMHFTIQFNTGVYYHVHG